VAFGIYENVAGHRLNRVRQDFQILNTGEAPPPPPDVH